jgi:hypothetical protein
LLALQGCALKSRVGLSIYAYAYAYAFGSALCKIAVSFQRIAPAMEAGMSYRKMSLLEFQRRFATEDDCWAALERARWPEGVVCPRCEGRKATRHGPRKLLQCSACRYQVSVTAGMILHRTHPPLAKWFWAMWLVAQDKGGVSAQRLARQLELSYRAAWTLLHKLRKAMAARDAGYPLTGSIEMDDAFFGGPASGKRGRGAANKTKVVVMVENREERAGFIGMKTVSQVSSAEIGAAAAVKMAPGQEIRTDGHAAYRTLGHTHHAQPVPPDKVRELLPRGAHRHLQRQDLPAGDLPRRPPQVPPDLPGRVLLPLQSPHLGVHPDRAAHYRLLRR